MGLAHAHPTGVGPLVPWKPKNGPHSPEYQDSSRAPSSPTGQDEETELTSFLVAAMPKDHQYGSQTSECIRAWWVVLKHRFLGPIFSVLDSVCWAGAQELVFLTSSQRMLILLVQGPPFETAEYMALPLKAGSCTSGSVPPRLLLGMQVLRPCSQNSGIESVSYSGAQGSGCQQALQVILMHGGV